MTIDRLFFFLISTYAMKLSRNSWFLFSAPGYLFANMRI